MNLQQEYEEAAVFWEKVDTDAKKMPGEAVQKALDQFLGTHRLCVLATACRTFTRATALEYTWHDGALWIFTEGGFKFKGLKKNKNVAAAIFDTNASFGGLKSLQIEGTAEIVELYSDEYNAAAAFRKIPLETLRKLPEPMWLLKIMPTEITCLNSAWKRDGFGSRQLWRK